MYGIANERTQVSVFNMKQHEVDVTKKEKEINNEIHK